MRHVACSPLNLCVAGGLALALVSSTSHAEIVYLTQSRVISATTTVDLNTVTASAPDFAPFNNFVESSALFTGPLGVPRINRGRTTITSILDSNSVLAGGNFECEGGEDENGDIELGEASLDIFLTFTLTENSPFQLFSSARPGLLAGDEFEIELNRLPVGGGTEDIFAIDQTSPPQVVDINGVLLAGDYTLKVKVEFSASEQDQSAGYLFFLNVPTPASVLPFAAGAIFASRRRRR